ncbi:MAG: hypothetical protein K2Q06_07665 [Parvularculaceae bacterium]|nr:hypothetical protein [Parvularculaceae bacterium]
MTHAPPSATRDFFWCGHGLFPGKQPFRFGTVAAPDATSARAALAALWAELMPIDPPDFEPERGLLIWRSQT